MGASPKTTDFLKECMADALLQAMKEKPFSKITVNEITDSAGVNRSTWFRNFTDKNEAITFKLIRLWNRWADEHGLKERRRYTLDTRRTSLPLTTPSKIFFPRFTGKNSRHVFITPFIR